MIHLELNRYGCYYNPCWIGQRESDDLENHLLSLEWETKRTARHEYFMSDKQLSYSYGGNNDIVYNAKPFTREILEVADDLNNLLGTQFNAVFLNKYDDEKQHLGWHADDFAGMDQEQPIAVISFGAEREIWVKKKEDIEKNNWLTCKTKLNENSGYIPTELKTNSFGYFKNKIVCVDYGN